MLYNDLFSFHLFNIAGKKEECPACGEKVDLRTLYANKPWETRNLSWIQMLDMFRYLLVWQPTILVGLHFILHIFHLDEMPDATAADGVDLSNDTIAHDTLKTA